MFSIKDVSRRQSSWESSSMSNSHGHCNVSCCVGAWSTPTSGHIEAMWMCPEEGQSEVISRRFTKGSMELFGEGVDSRVRQRWVSGCALTRPPLERNNTDNTSV